jgi:hypothetical protein
VEATFEIFIEHDYVRLEIFMAMKIQVMVFWGMNHAG